MEEESKRGEDRVQLQRKTPHREQDEGARSWPSKGEEKERGMVSGEGGKGDCPRADGTKLYYQE